MSKTKRLADFFRKECQLYNTDLTRTLHGTHHGPRGTFPWWSLPYPGSWKPTWNPTDIEKHNLKLIMKEPFIFTYVPGTNKKSLKH